MLLTYGVHHRKKAIRITACGSAVACVQELDWFMVSFLAFGTNIFIYTKLLAIKVKGLLRKLIDSVHFSSRGDLGDRLKPCMQLIL